MEEIQAEEPVEEEPTESEQGFCVFQRIEGTEVLIAKCDAIVLAIFQRIFGPASYGECKKYVHEHKEGR